MLWTEYRPLIKIGPKGALGSHEISPIHSAPSLGQIIYHCSILLGSLLHLKSISLSNALMGFLRDFVEFEHTKEAKILETTTS